MFSLVLVFLFHFSVWLTFSFLVKFSDSCLDETYNDVFGIITSPGFGNTYFNNLDCQWNIVVTAGLNIRLTFSTFDLEYGRDILYVRGTLQAPLELWVGGTSQDSRMFESFCSESLSQIVGVKNIHKVARGLCITTSRWVTTNLSSVNNF